MLRLKGVFHKYSVAKILIATALFVWLLKSGRLDLNYLLSIRLDILHVLGMLILLMGIFAQGLRWRWLLKTQGIRLSFLKTFQLVWIGQFFALILPGVVGGELVRGFYVARETPDARIASVSTVLVDRAFGLYAILLLGVASVVSLYLSKNLMTTPVRQLGVLNLALLTVSSSLLLALCFAPSRGVALRILPERFRTYVEASLNAYRKNVQGMLICFIFGRYCGDECIPDSQPDNRDRT